MPGPSKRTPRDVAESFAAVSRQMLEAVRRGDTTAALACSVRRAGLVAELAAFGRPDVVTESLVAAGQKSGTEALDLASTRSAELRATLDSVGRGRSGLKAYGPGRGSDESLWDMAG